MLQQPIPTLYRLSQSMPMVEKPKVSPVRRSWFLMRRIAWLSIRAWTGTRMVVMRTARPAMQAAAGRTAIRVSMIKIAVGVEVPTVAAVGGAATHGIQHSSLVGSAGHHWYRHRRGYIWVAAVAPGREITAWIRKVAAVRAAVSSSYGLDHLAVEP